MHAGKKTRKKMIKTDRCTHNSLAWTRENYERNKKLNRKKCKPNKFVDRLPYIRHTTLLLVSETSINIIKKTKMRRMIVLRKKKLRIEC